MAEATPAVSGIEPARGEKARRADREAGLPIRWLAVMTAARAEARAERDIQQLGVRAWYPCLTVRRCVGRGRRRSVDELLPLFSRYVFAGVPLGDDSHVAAINAADSVATVVHVDGVPLEIPAAVMAELMARCDTTGLVLQAPGARQGAAFGFAGRIGDRVRMAATTPFAGLVAEIARLDRLDSRGEVGLWLEALGGRTAMTVPLGAVGEIVRD